MNDSAVESSAPRRAVGAVVWLTGLSGSGKSTIAAGLACELEKLRQHHYVLDGDVLRRGLNADLGFSPEDRVENIRRVAEVSRILALSGCIAIAALISPYRADRARARRIAADSGVAFIEIYVNAPLAICESRDPKGLYKRARAGEIAQFTGVSAPYEAPEHAELTLCTGAECREESITTALDFLRTRLGI